MFTGSIPALVTPLYTDGGVDYPTLRKLIDWHVAEGTDGLVIVGTSGESPTVSFEEHREIHRAIASRDAPGAKAAIERHIASARQFVFERQAIG